MEKQELEYYSKIANWDFSQIKCTSEKLTNWDFYDEIQKNTNEESLCLDLGTAGGEKIFSKYPKVGMIIATDFSEEMIKTAKENRKNFRETRVKFAVMNNFKIMFPNDLFDLVSARHTPIDARQIYDVLIQGGTLVIEGVDQKDCWELKTLFKRGQAYKDKKSIFQKDYEALLEAGFSRIEKIQIRINEYYETREDLLALLLKTPILDDFSEMERAFMKHGEVIEKELLDEYVRKNKTKKGILLKRLLYGIVAQK